MTNNNSSSSNNGTVAPTSSVTGTIQGSTTTATATTTTTTTTTTVPTKAPNSAIAFNGKPTEVPIQRQRTTSGEDSSTGIAFTTTPTKTGIPTTSVAPPPSSTSLLSSQHPPFPPPPPPQLPQEHHHQQHQQQPMEVRFISASEVALASKPKSVLASRKQELLQQARALRLEWIRKVPFPYLNLPLQGTATTTDGATAAVADVVVVDPLAVLRETHAGRQMPVTMNALNYLYYGYFPEQQQQQRGAAAAAAVDDAAAVVHQRLTLFIAELLQNVPNAVPTPEQARKMALDNNNDNDRSSLHKDPLLSWYHVFLQKLSDPAAAMLVQWMRSFCRNLMQGKQHQQQQSQPRNDASMQGGRQQQQQQQEEEAKVALIRMIQSFATSTLDAIQTHVLWKEDHTTTTSMTMSAMAGTSDDGDDDKNNNLTTTTTKRSFESFLYGHCRDYIDSILWTTDMERREMEWIDRMNALQFVTATHLEVTCLQPYHSNQIQELLQESVNALLSISLYHAPYEKLQRILLMYRCINVALSQTLNQPNTTTTNTNSANQNKKLPSADDVLPTIILTVLQAKPRRLLYNLQLIDDFLLPEQLRGEAGYAYTNLYGAIQFLTDLNIDDDTTTILDNVDGNGNATTTLGETKTSTTQKQPPSSLSITAKEFRQGLARCRAAAQERRLANQQKQQQRRSQPAAVSSLTPTAIMALVGGWDLTTILHNPRYGSGGSGSGGLGGISPHDIRMARANGETITVEWALQRHRETRPDYDWQQLLRLLPWEEEEEEDVEEVDADPGKAIVVTAPAERMTSDGMNQTTTSSKQSAVVTTVTRSSNNVGHTARSSAATSTTTSNFPTTMMGFRRPYSFLSVQPEDIKVSDLPKLLEEYRIMVHTTEELLAERQAKLSNQRREQLNKDERILYERVKSVDPSLLQTTPKKDVINLQQQQQQQQRKNDHS